MGQGASFQRDGGDLRSQTSAAVDPRLSHRQPGPKSRRVQRSKSGCVDQNHMSAPAATIGGMAAAAHNVPLSAEPAQRPLPHEGGGEDEQAARDQKETAFEVERPHASA